MNNALLDEGFETLFLDGFSSPRVVDWLNWVAGKDLSVFVALPMIQRGSVWKPKQIITLWDSLLRGMPIGALLLSRLRAKDKLENPVLVRMVGSSELKPVPDGGGAALVDGQQRTLAMLLGWPQGTAEQRGGRTLWVDFADKPAPENLFRMHLTSKAHPYGYSKSDPNAKLSLGERRESRRERNGEEFPWDSCFPIRLTELLEIYLENSGDLEKWKEAVHERLHSASAHRKKTWKHFLSGDAKWDASRAIDRFALALQTLHKLKVPLIAIPENCFVHEEGLDGEDPALAVLFKRVGTGGTALSDADYVYSVIKHHLPQAFQLVESLASQSGFAQVLGPIDIVMTAVRLVAADTKATDFESPSKANFDTLRKDKEFLNNFLKLVESGYLSNALQALTEGLKFRGAKDPGLPKHAFTLVPRPVLQVLLMWTLQSSKEAIDHATQCRALVERSRHEMLRFALYAPLGMKDMRKASAWSFAWLQSQKLHNSSDASVFPGKHLVQHLIDRSSETSRDVAWPLLTKMEMESLAVSTPTNSEKPLSGWERFRREKNEMPGAMEVFRAWWGSGGYHHQMLLWLQREYVDRIDSNPEEVRADDEVPYDYDHICPANHWSNWTGVTSKDRLIDFLSTEKNGGHWQVGNSIGNVRVWYASDNRGDGDLPAATKLGQKGEPGTCNPVLLADSAISLDDWNLWAEFSHHESAASWSAERARAFQLAVERRVTFLYAKYFDELNFDEWFPITGTTKNDAMPQ